MRDQLASAETKLTTAEIQAKDAVGKLSKQISNLQASQAGEKEQTNRLVFAAQYLKSQVICMSITVRWRSSGKNQKKHKAHWKLNCKKRLPT